MNDNKSIKTNDNKSIKINKLRKAHIFPSIIFLLFSMLIAIGALVGILITSLIYLAEERIDYTAKNAAMISSSLSTAVKYEQNVINSILRDVDAPEAIYVLDGNKNVIAYYGDQTYNINASFTSIADFYFSNKYTFCDDNGSADDIIDENGGIRINELLKVINHNKFKSIDDDLQSVVFEIKFWVKNELSGDRTVLVKGNVPIYAKDFLNSLIIGIIVFCVMLLPIIFLFINVIMCVQNQKRMTRLLYTDAITGGNNYVYFLHTAGKALSSKFKSRKLFMIVDLTIMKYRSYCNYHGIRAGEELLEDMHKQLDSYMEKNEFCAHFGKSSFVLFMKAADRESGELRMQNLVNELSEKYGHGVLKVHAGIYFSKPHILKKGLRLPSRRIIDPADCFNRASAARATLADENIPSVAVYNYKLLEEQIWSHKVEEKMQKALDNEEFQVYFQPKYNPATEKLAGAEALVRWINGEDGFISPGKFVPIFENNGFITSLDDYMLSHVAELQAKWISEGKSVVPISVNVSRAHFASPDLAQHICEIVDKYNVPHNVIEIELTESAFFDDKQSLLTTVHELGRLGFEISMDDFGAGYSSLNSLKDLPLDVLKLDAEFFRGEDEENRGEIIISQAISLAKKLNMRIVAEGVEKKEQVEFLADQGCDMIQSYYYAKPMPADEYAKLLEDNSNSSQD